jgi:hypothetical protein
MKKKNLETFNVNIVFRLNVNHANHSFQLFSIKLQKMV